MSTDNRSLREMLDDLIEEYDIGQVLQILVNKLNYDTDTASPYMAQQVEIALKIWKETR